MSQESSHYYTRAGEPRHTQACGPNAKNTTRATNIKDARKQELLPSVSACTKILSAPALDYYKSQQMAQACFNSPPGSGEPFDDYFRSMAEESGKDAGGAAAIGTQVHAALESYYAEPLTYGETLIDVNGVPFSSNEFVLPTARAIEKLGIEIMHAERVVVNNPYGYAGTADIIFKSPTSYGVLDFKTKRTKPGKEVEPTEPQPLQIAAYIAAFWGTSYDYPIGEKAIGYNVYISTTEPGRVDVVKWDYEQLKESWTMFKHCLALFRWRAKYDPRQK